METVLLPIAAIAVGPRKRAVENAIVQELAQSIERQGLWQPIGVVAMEGDEERYTLVFGAHRLAAMQALGEEMVPAHVLPSDLTSEAYLLIELQENSVRNDLTHVQRKAYAGDIGMLLAKLSPDGDVANRHDEWFVDFAKSTNVPRRTLADWWQVFCEETGRRMPPGKALQRDQQAFYAWLQAHREREAAEKARREHEVRQARMQQDIADALDNLYTLEADYGREIVLVSVIHVFLARDTTESVKPSV